MRAPYQQPSPCSATPIRLCARTQRGRSVDLPCLETQGQSPPRSPPPPSVKATLTRHRRSPLPASALHRHDVVGHRLDLHLAQRTDERRHTPIGRAFLYLLDDALARAAAQKL